MIPLLHRLRKRCSEIPRVFTRVLGRYRKRRVREPSAAKADFSRADVIASLFWLLAAVAMAWVFMDALGKDEFANALFPVVFAVILLMINQVASWQADRERRKHEKRIEGLLTDIRDALKKFSNTHVEDDKECGK